EHAANGVCDIVKELGGTKAFVVTDQPLLKTGLLKPILESFEDVGVVLFSDVPSDSDIDVVNQAATQARQDGCDVVLAIGGGSVLDTAKVVNICLSLGGDILDYQGLNNLSSPLLPLIAVPTTAGTGSEVSMVAMVKDRAEGKKLLFGSRFLAPQAAVLDPYLTLSLPPKLTAATGLDALTHAIEAYSAIISNSHFTDALCVESMRHIFEHLPRATKNGDDVEARTQMLVASTMAGVAFTNSGVGIVHALAHATGGKFGTHHGVTNSIFLPHGMHFNLDAISARYASLARILGISQSRSDTEAARALIDKVEALCVEVGLPRHLRDVGVPKLDRSELEELAFLTSSDPAIMFNPKDSTVEDIIAIYERAY
ncbi:MAG TPA: iron-containing alcohol dehydrogenase, partial [Candidatus Obscuribacterales bacterium]